MNEADFIRSTGVVTLNVGPKLLDVTASNLLRKFFEICQMVINYSNNDINIEGLVVMNCNISKAYHLL